MSLMSERLDNVFAVGSRSDEQSPLVLLFVNPGWMTMPSMPRYHSVNLW